MNQADDHYHRREFATADYSRGVPHLAALEDISDRLIALGMDPCDVPPSLLMHVHDTQGTIQGYLKELDRLRSQTTQIISDEVRVRAQCDAFEALMVHDGQASSDHW